MDYAKESLKLHYDWQGKIEVVARAKVNNKEDLSLAYTPGVAQPCLEIQKDINKSYELTRRWNTVAVITDGTAVLGLGDIGPEAGMPVMEGKCVLFKEFGGVDAIPLCIRSKDVDEIVNAVALFAGSFGGINLEDIAAPRCFEIERKLKERCDIPVFHDDQHGTAVVCTAALINAAKVVGKELKDMTIVFNGAGSAGIAIAKLFLHLGVGNIIMCDINGILDPEDPAITSAQLEMTKVTNKDGIKGKLADAMVGADAFVGVSRPNMVTPEMIQSMADKPILMPMANPVPEIMPDEAKAAGAAVVGTGRSDFPNQINNVLAFPGIFRGALDCRASDITENMKLAAAHALADLITPEELNAEYILPAAFDPRVRDAVAHAVAKAAREDGVARMSAGRTAQLKDRHL